MARIGTLVTGAAVAAVLAATAGCGGRSARVARPAPEVQASWTSCDDTVPAEDRQGAEATALPRVGGFAATAAVVCSIGPQSRPDGGQDLVATESRAEDTAALLAALRLPDQARTGGACTMELPVVPWFALLDAEGRWTRPGLPVDRCGKIRIEVRTAVRDLKLTLVASRPVREIESAGAKAAGCSQTWADVIAMEAGPGAATRARVPFRYPLAGAPALRRCVYRVPAAEQGSAKPAGTFETGGVLTADRRAAIETALAATGPAADCSTPASRFALLVATDSAGAAVYVELDGCRRVMAEPRNGELPLGQAAQTLIELLGTR